MNETKAEAKRIKAQVHKHGVVHLFRADDGRTYPVPGYQVELIGVYREPVPQAFIEEDLQPEARP